MTLAGQKILYLVSEDWYFCSHRLPIARAARDAGAEVVVATRVQDNRSIIEAEGFRLVQIELSRSGRNPFHDAATLNSLINLYRRERPDIVHHVALKPALYGSIASWLTGIPSMINAFAGMGFLFISEGLFARAVRPIVRVAFRFLLNRPTSRVIVQNPDDFALFTNTIGISPERITIIKGSGVDIEQYQPAPEPDGVPVAVCVSRMLWDKGIGELVEAARELRDRGTAIRIRLVGPVDENPAAIPMETISSWSKEGIVDVAGSSDDVAGEYARAHIAVLPSYREGLPKSLLEAAAAGLPMVATNVAGCREICLHNETGLLVPLKSSEALADALQTLAEDSSLRARYGREARALTETAFSEPVIVSQTIALYESILSR